MASYWRRVDDRLIRRGKLVLDLNFVRNYADELSEMNEGKKGRPYKITNRLQLIPGDLQVRLLC
ncbi:MAG: hypothetical protein QXD61_08290 [Candidatus Caldarchaeum sp.]